VLKEFILKIKNEKMAQIKAGKVGNDLLFTLLSEGDDVYGVLGDELGERTLIEDVITIYAAAVSTTQITVNNICKYIHMDRYLPVKEKLLAEIDSLLAFEAWDAEGNAINRNSFLEAASYENIQENFEYTMMCFRESMRIEPPVGFSTSHTVTKDVVLAKGTPKELKINAGEMLHIFTKKLHHDVNQWGENHNEFIPERFDSNSQHFKAPSGKPRHPYSYAPFLGGHRICLGKTFAENVAKKLIAMTLKFYALELADPKLKLETFEYELF